MAHYSIHKWGVAVFTLFIKRFHINLAFFLASIAMYLAGPGQAYAWTRTVDFEDGVIEQAGVGSAFDPDYHGGSDARFSAYSAQSDHSFRSIATTHSAAKCPLDRSEATLLFFTSQT
jgi:hypothetical protein